MGTAILNGLASLLNTVVNRAFPDKVEAAKIQAALTTQLLQLNGEELKSATSIITAEANGESWLQRNWRPLMMIWFGILIGMYWFGYSPEGMSEATVKELFTLIKIGLGGYVIGRSGEKIVKEWKK